MKSLLVLFLSLFMVSSCYLNGYIKVDYPRITSVNTSRLGAFTRLNITVSNPFTRSVTVDLKCCIANTDCSNSSSVRVTVPKRSDKVVGIIPPMSGVGVEEIECGLEPVS